MSKPDRLAELEEENRKLKEQLQSLHSNGTDEVAAPTTGKKPAVYLRVSTKKQEYDSQETYMRDYLQSHLGIEWDDVLVYRDKVSGGAVERKSLRELEQDIIKGRISTVYFYRLDRLSRAGSEHVIELLQLANSKGVDFWFAQDTILNTTNRMVRMICLVLLAEKAREERETTIERIQDGLTAAKNKGRKLGRGFKHKSAKVKAAMKAYDGGTPAAEAAKKHGMSRAQLFNYIKYRKIVNKVRETADTEVVASDFNMEPGDIEHIVHHYAHFFTEDITEE